jgi:hypothetical protein
MLVAATKNDTGIAPPMVVRAVEIAGEKDVEAQTIVVALVVEEDQLVE